MEICNIFDRLGWYLSYCNNSQEKALLLCLDVKIKQLTQLLNTIRGEAELCDDPREIDPETVLKTIVALIDLAENAEVFAQVGSFRWEAKGFGDVKI